MINKVIIDEAFEFYNIDIKYKDKCYKLVDELSNNKYYESLFSNVYNILYCENFININKLWKIKDINKLFWKNVNPFITNLMIILGYQAHKLNLKKFNLSIKQSSIHKKRVKECFENDLKYRMYDGVRISQMLWAVYFIRIRIIEVGRLQYEYVDTLENVSTVKIHIPKGEKLDLVKVKYSIKNSKDKLKRIFHIENIKYICNSWLLSNQIYKLVEKNSNISLFHDLFTVTDGDNCIDDILNFVYGMNKCDDYEKLQEKTTLQKKIKEKLLRNEKIFLGLGVLK